MAFLPTDIPDFFKTFSADLLKTQKEAIHSVHLVGSVLTDDYHADQSDINSIIVADDVTIELLDFITSLGGTYRSKRIAAPLLMTLQYIEQSLDVFPVEFLSFSKLHKTIHGEDILEGLEIKPSFLRLQAEREIKGKLLWLHQCYIESLRDPKLLGAKIAGSIVGYYPLFRALLFLNGSSIPKHNHEILTSFNEVTGLAHTVYDTVTKYKNREIDFNEEELFICFKEYYSATKELVGYIDDLAL